MHELVDHVRVAIALCPLVELAECGPIDRLEFDWLEHIERTGVLERHPLGISRGIRFDQSTALRELEDPVQEHEDLLRRPRRDGPREEVATELIDIAGRERVRALLANFDALATSVGEDDLMTLEPVKRSVATKTSQEMPFGDVLGIVEGAALAPLLDPEIGKPRLDRVAERRDRLRWRNVVAWPVQRRSARLIEDLAKRGCGVLRRKEAARAWSVSGAPDYCPSRRASA